MEKIIKALKKILPAEHVNEVAKAVEEMIAENVAALESEFQSKLEEAYEQLAEERETDEVIAETGYQQAYEIIQSLMSRLDEQREEFENALEEGFEEAYSELQKERGRNQNLEVEVYEEADQKLQEMKNLMVDKIDEFLSLQESEIYESAKRDVLSDPRILEQRVAIEKMAELISDYMGSGSINSISSSKIDEMHRQVEELKGQMRIIEAKNVRLATQNNKLNEQVREAHQVITEATKIERTNRASKRKNASGRGQRVVNEQIISEYASTTNNKSAQETSLREGHDPLADLLVLSGLSES
jgi:tetratricopeptide (TPR) repeat protein